MVRKRSRIFLRMYIYGTTTSWSGDIIYNWRLKTEERVSIHGYKYSVDKSENRYSQRLCKGIGVYFFKRNKGQLSRYTSEQFVRVYLNACLS